MSIRDMVISLLLGLSLATPLTWYLVGRWSTVCWGYIPFFVVCETVVLLVGCINMYILLEGRYRSVRHQDFMDANLMTCSEKKWFHLTRTGNLPTILLIVPIYHEGLVVLERTLRAVDQIIYPRHLLTVVIGDDGSDDETRDFVETQFPTMHYHRRERILGHAKAGNLNDILFAAMDSDNHDRGEMETSILHEMSGWYRYTGELVLVLDCDMAPMPDILSKLIPYFYQNDELYTRDRDCCFVQSPQKFCNIRGFDFLGQHYNFFYQVVLPAYNGFSLGVPCCGTNVLFDRHHLTRIGGFQLGSITEDFKTSLRFHAMGLHSRFYSGVTAVGLAPTTLVDFFQQRQRWSIGGLQIVFSRDYADLFWRLPWVYKWIYTFSGLSPILSIFLGILLFGPIMDLFSHDIFLCGISPTVYLLHFMPYIGLYVFYLLYLHGGLSWMIFILSVQESIFMIPMFLYFLWTFLIRRLGWQEISFKITPKQAMPRNDADSCMSAIWILLPYVAYLILAGFSLLVAVRHHPVLRIDLGWLGFIVLQLLNPFCFVIQSWCI